MILNTRKNNHLREVLMEVWQIKCIFIVGPIYIPSY